MNVAGMFLAALAGAGGPSPYQQGLAAFEAGDVAAARVHLEAVDVAREPHAAYLLGVLAERRQDYLAGARHFEEFVAAVKPGHDLIAAAQGHRAYCLAAGNRLTEAVRLSAARPVEEPDRTACLLFAWSDLLAAQRDPDAATRKTAARRAYARFGRFVRVFEPASAEARNGEGLARLAMAEAEPGSRRAHLEAAAAAFSRAAEREPRPVFHLNAGAALTRLGRRGEAIEAFRRAADLAPEGDPVRVKAMRSLGKLKAEAK